MCEDYRCSTRTSHQDGDHGDNVEHDHLVIYVFVCFLECVCVCARIIRVATNHLVKLQSPFPAPPCVIAIATVVFLRGGRGGTGGGVHACIGFQYQAGVLL